jgi:type IV pilus assembly protein PilF
MIRQALITGIVVLGVTACASTEPIGKTADVSKRADLRTQLAINYMQRNQLEVAREELEHALEIAPDHSGANHAMAALQERLGNNEEAERHYRQAVRSDAENSQAAHDFGTFLCRRGRVQEALEQYENALSNPLYRQPDISNLRAGECLLSHGTTQAAESYFRKALHINPGLSLALYYMADINFRRKNYLSARGYIERHFSIASKTPESLLLAYKIEHELKAPKVAEEYASLLRGNFARSKEAKELEKLTRTRK